MSEEVDLLPRMLLPLAGPTPEDLDPDDVELLPMDLQYLDEDKKVGFLNQDFNQVVDSHLPFLFFLD